MRTVGTTIEVNRGEVFNLTRSIVTQDGVPYILPNKLLNPYLVFSISDSLFRQAGKMHNNYWLSLSTYPSFENLAPVFVENLDGPPAIPSSVYYTNDGYNNKNYYYWTGDSYKPYSFKFSKTFISSDTNKWIEGVYKYQCKIASGQTSIDWLTGTYIGLYKGKTPPKDKITLARYICKVRPDLLEGIDWDAPLINYETFDVLKQPAKLIVKHTI